MIKMSTLFKKHPEDLSKVIDEFNEKNSWIFTEGKAYVKRDGTSVAFINGGFYKRYESRPNKKKNALTEFTQPLEGAIACSERDPKTGKQVFWEPVTSQDKWHMEALYKFQEQNGGNKPVDGTYELCGPRINGNKEKLPEHVFIKHDSEPFELEISKETITYENIKKILEENNIEGIVFHNVNDPTVKCKIRRKDFGIKWEGRDE